MIWSDEAEKYKVCEAEFLWMYGGDITKNWLASATSAIPLSEKKKFSDWEYVAVLLSNIKGISTFRGEVWRLSEWIAMSEDPSCEPFMPYVYLSDTTWKKNFGSSVRIHAIIGRETVEGLREDLERTQKEYEKYNMGGKLCR